MDIWEDWLELAKKGNFTIQICKDCNQNQFYPRSFCQFCNGKNLELVTYKDQAYIYSFTEILRSPNPEIFTPPYFIGLVEIDNAIKVICQLNLNKEEISIGNAVNFKELTDDGIIIFH